MIRRLRILLTIPDFVGSGAVRELRNLAGRLVTSGFEPHICIWRRKFDYPPPVDVPLHLVPKTRTWHGVKAVLGFARLVDELRPDIVFSQTHYQSIIAGTSLSTLRRRPAWICRLTNNPCREIPLFLWPWARWSLSQADRVAGCSQGVSAGLAAYLQLSSRRVVTLRNVVDLEDIERQSREGFTLNTPRRRFTVVHAGRCHPQKNQRLLLEAFRRFRGRSAELWMLGQGPLRRSLEARARRLGIAGQVRWLGFQPNPYSVLRAADCFALSSDYEGLPNALIESLACGTPVISTAAPYGPEEIVQPGQNGWLTPVGDAEALADALERLADSPEDQRRMSEAAPASIWDRFEPNQILDTYERLIHETVQEHQLRSGRSRVG